MHLRKYLNNKKGLTLLEVLLAVLILGIIVVSLAPLLVFSSHSAEYNRAKTEATNLANKKMEEIRALSFNEIGTLGGNPAGNIPQEETVKIGRYTFKIETFINWIEEGGCLSGNNADWDYKQARIRVTCPGFFYQGKQTVNVELSSLFSRDAEQPALTGANLRVCVFRAWGAGLNPNTGEFDVNFVKPVSGVKVTAKKDGSTAQVYTTSKGSALFLAMPAGNYEVDVDPSLRGMIIFPASYPQENIEITNNNTRQLFAWVEEPCSLRIFLKDLQENPIILNLGSDAVLQLIHPYPAGFKQDHKFKTSAPDGEILNHPFKNLWPVGTGFAGRYNFSTENQDIPGYVLSGKNGENGAWDQDKNQPWEGDFTAPGTFKKLSIYLIKLPEPYNPIFSPSAWTNGNSTQIKQNNYQLADWGIAFTELTIDPEANPPLKMYILKPAIFKTEHNSNELTLSSGSPQYTAAELLFSNKKLTISNHAELRLKSNIISFLGSIELQKQGQSPPGKLTFNVITSPIPYQNTYVSITDENGKLAIIEAYNGSEIRDCKGNPGIAGIKYGEVYFYHDVKDSQENIILKKGAYYFPDGFTLPDDAGKLPSQGGPLQR